MSYRNNKRISKSSGFSLIEITIVVAIIGFLSTIIWPLFTRYEHKVSRVDGIAGLEAAINAIEGCGAQNGGDYTNCLLGGFATSPNNKYTIRLPNAGDSFYTLTATKNNGVDNDCGVLSIDNLGQQNETGNRDIRYCWSR